MIKLFELFAGIGANSKALRNLGIEHELVGFSEFDKYASKSFCAIHDVDESLNFGDITKIDTDKLPDFDLLTWGFPCQDISVAGKQAGISEGTRSGLYFEGLRILKAKLPKYSIIENVKNLTGKKFKAQFDSILNDLEQLGYSNYWKVLNAKDYGIPQNRERVFIVSIRKDTKPFDWHKPFEFPTPFDNGLRLKDMLESDVDEKYYINSAKVEKLLSQLDSNKNCVGNINPSGNGMNGKVYNSNNAAPTITTNKGEGSKIVVPCLTPDRSEKRQNGRRFKEDGEPMFTLTGQDRHGVLTNEPIVCEQRTDEGLRFFKNNVCGSLRTIDSCGDKRVIQVGNIVDTGNFDNPQRGRIYSDEGCSPALNTCGGGGLEPKILKNYRIRKLTPKECFRLMGFTDSDIQKCIDIGMSNTQLYKQAGNSIVTNVLEHIYSNLL